MPSSRNRQQVRSIYIIIPVHNRKVFTLKCLEHLYSQNNLNDYNVVVIDDGSTDGTSESIIAKYPHVHLLQGDGNLWWTGAIKQGMEYAYSRKADYCVWLNDDTLPAPGAIQSLVDYCSKHPKTIAGGNILDPQTREPSYGGVISQKLKIRTVFATSEQSTQCDGLNGNLVCLPTSLISNIGYPNKALCPQYHGDTVYTHSAKRVGYQLVLRRESVAYCTNDHKPISWIRSDQTFLEIIKERMRIKSPHYWKAHLTYYINFLGVLGIALYIYDVWLKFIFLMHVRKILPSLTQTD